jgi:integrase
MHTVRSTDPSRNIERAPVLWRPKLPPHRRGQFEQFLETRATSNAGVTAVEKIAWLTHLVDTETVAFETIYAYARALINVGNADCPQAALDEETAIRAYVLTLRHDLRLRTPQHFAPPMPEAIFIRVIEELDKVKPGSGMYRLRAKTAYILSWNSGLHGRELCGLRGEQFIPCLSGYVLRHRRGRTVYEIPLARAESSALCPIQTLETWRSTRPCDGSGFLFPRITRTSAPPQPMCVGALKGMLMRALRAIGEDAGHYSLISIARAYLVRLQEDARADAAYELSAYSSRSSLKHALERVRAAAI